MERTSDLGSQAWSASPKPDLMSLLKAVVDRGASDLHLSLDTPPMLRIDGRLLPVRSPPLTAADTRTMCYTLLSEAQKKAFETNSELDFAVGVAGLARFRVNVFLQRGAVAAAFRFIPSRVRSFDELGLPRVLAEIARKPRGLVLITGPTGSGKSTTLAAILDLINSEQSGHIITLEDPIEYMHANKKCLVSQREISSDTANFKTALKYVLRQDPDVVLIGEMRDLETIEAALTISETGHLVLGTLHTNSAVQTINRIVDVFPPHRQGQVRSQLAMTLEAVVSQQLVPKVAGGRALVLEILLNTVAVRHLIRDEKIHQIYSQMQMGGLKYGMQTLNQSLAELVRSHTISHESAQEYCSDPEELRNLLLTQSPQSNKA